MGAGVRSLAAPEWWFLISGGFWALGGSLWFDWALFFRLRIVLGEGVVHMETALGFDPDRGVREGGDEDAADGRVQLDDLAGEGIAPWVLANDLIVAFRWTLIFVVHPGGNLSQRRACDKI